MMILLLRRISTMVVTRQKNKKWGVDISDGYDAVTGKQKRHRKTDFKSRKEAEQYEADFRIKKLHQIGYKQKIALIIFTHLFRKKIHFVAINVVR